MNPPPFRLLGMLAITLLLTTWGLGALAAALLRDTPMF